MASREALASISRGDVTVIATPSGEQFDAYALRLTPFLRVAATAALMLAVLAAVGYFRYGSLSRCLAVLRAETLLAEPGVIEVERAHVGVPIVREVVVVNLGDEELSLVGTQAGCRCAATLVNREPLAPSSSRTVKVQVTFTEAGCDAVRGVALHFQGSRLYTATVTIRADEVVAGEPTLAEPKEDAVAVR